ncbi:MAG: hypothetical protein V3V84_07860 [Candidatus Bathyarchaeia archaeon]
METLNQNSIAEKLKGVLSDEALTLLLGSEALQELLKTQKDLEEDKVTCEKQIVELKLLKTTHLERITILYGKVSKYEEKEDAMLAREKYVTAKESEVRQAIFERNFYKERGDEFKDLQHATVRNTTFRNTLMTEKHTSVDGTPAYNQNGCDYGPTPGFTEKHPVFESQEKTEE